MNRKSIRQKLKESATFPQYKIKGKYLDRVKFGKEPWYDGSLEECEFCYTKVNSLHSLGCGFECSPCGEHRFAIDCKCEPVEDEGNS